MYQVQVFSLSEYCRLERETFTSVKVMDMNGTRQGDISLGNDNYIYFQCHKRFILPNKPLHGMLLYRVPFDKWITFI